MPIDIANPGDEEAALTAALRALLPVRCAEVRLSDNLTGIDITSEYFISWGTEVRDTDGFWSLANPDRLTVPAGVFWVEVLGQVSGTSSTDDTWRRVIVLHYNSSDTLLDTFGVERPNMEDSWRLQAFTGLLAVNEGDYFRMSVQEESDTSVNILASRSFLKIRAIP